MNEEETILLKKKKKKIFDYEEAVKILRPMIKQWKDLDEEVARKLHEYYMIPECRFIKLCELLGVTHPTIYALFDKYNLPRKFEKLTEHEHKNMYSEVENDLQLSDAVVDETLETELEDRKYKETYTILKNAQRLSKDMFNVPEKDELIEELQDTIKKLTTLLLKLESNLGD